MTTVAADLPGPSSRAGPGDALASVALVILLVNVALIAFDVLMRWVFRSPQSWVSDLAQVSYPVAIACCIPAALESGHMIAIRFLGEALGPRGARWLDLLGQVALSAVLGLFAWKMFWRAWSDWGAGYKTSTIALPVAPSWMLVAALLVFSTLLQVRLTWRTLKPV